MTSHLRLALWTLSPKFLQNNTSKKPASFRLKNSQLLSMSNDDDITISIQNKAVTVVA